MKKVYYLLITIILLMACSNAKAQGGFSDIIRVSPSDATKLINAYGEPLFKGIGVGLNSGWTNTAKPKKLLHFELRFTATGAFTPVSSQSFDVTKIGLSNNVGPADANQTIAPTIGGERSTDGPLMNIYDANHNKVADFNLPSGKLSLIPSPQLQLTVGLVYGTDVTLRYIPTVTVSSVGSVSMIGGGIKHDITQYIFGPAKKLVPFDLSIMLAYSKLNLNADLNVQPDQGAVHDPTDPNKNTDFSDQHTDAHFSSFLTEAFISKKLLFFTPFFGLGYNTASTNLATIGNYPVTTRETLSQEFYTVYTDPVNIHETSISGFRTDAGFQINIGFSIYFAYSYAQYSSITGGIGLSF